MSFRIKHGGGPVVGRVVGRVSRWCFSNTGIREYGTWDTGCKYAGHLSLLCLHAKKKKKFVTTGFLPWN